MVTALARVLTTVHQRIDWSPRQLTNVEPVSDFHLILPPEWELMFDSYDYESLVGPVFLSREFDNDGDVLVRQYVETFMYHIPYSG